MDATQRRLLVRTAIVLGGRRAPPPATTDLPVAAWLSCLRSAELLNESEQRGWQVAQAACRERFYRQLGDLGRQLDASIDELAHAPAARPATALEIYDDLCALETEFAGLRIDLQARELAVTTEPIILEGVPLGAFEIVLPWSESVGPQSYQVVALDPNPAATNEAVTHPHVSDDQLCEGEGQAAIRHALAAGRLFDFFTVVGRALATYNESSAYVPLRRWHGTECSQCGYVSDDDRTSSCERCECNLCDECGAGCGACGDWCCADCTASCNDCGDSHCGACLRRCSNCHDHFCEECVDHGICHCCRDAANDDGAEEEDASGGAACAAAPEAAGAEVLAHSVGQTAISA